VSVYRIITKLGTKMCHYTTFLCTKFSRQSDNPFPLYGNFHTKTKRRKKNKKKNEETKPIFESSYLTNAWRDLVEIWNVGYWQWRASPQQKSSGFEQAERSYVYAKIAFLFFLLIYSRVWRTGFLGHTTHYCVSLLEHWKEGSSRKYFWQNFEQICLRPS